MGIASLARRMLQWIWQPAANAREGPLVDLHVTRRVNVKMVVGTEPVVLASTSPRRREMLARHGVPHVAVAPGFDDGRLRRGAVTAAQWVAALAYLKASAPVPMREAARRGWRVLGADTVCVMDDRLIGQPADADEAREILRAFERCSHDVLTGAALVDADAGSRILFVDVAHVRVGEIGETGIEEYVRSGLWRGKAGAYNLSERLAAGWPIRVDGDPDTVMGLPMRRLLRVLRRGRATRGVVESVRESIS